MNQSSLAPEKQLLNYIGTISFALVDIVEYLDTHPKDTEAISYFHHLNRLKNQAMSDYARLYGPLTLSSVESCDTQWDWALQPPPWKGGC